MQIAKNSRWTRDPTLENGKPVRVYLTERDVEIFKLLARYKYLPADYIHAFVGGYYNHFIQRLGLLQRKPNLYIHRPPAQRENASANYRTLIYELDDRGANYLRERNIDFSLRKGTRNFAHELMACQIAASLELGARATTAVTFTQQAQVPISFPFVRKGNRESIVPDWPPFMLGNRFFLGFEADCGTEPINASDYERSSIQKKFIAYLNVLEQQTYRTICRANHVYIPFVTTTRVRMESMLALLEHLEPGPHAKYFLFKHIPSFTSFDKPKPPDGHMLVEPWATLKGPLYLNQ